MAWFRPVRRISWYLSICRKNGMVERSWLVVQPALCEPFETSLQEFDHANLLAKTSEAASSSDSSSSVEREMELADWEGMSEGGSVRQE